MWRVGRIVIATAAMCGRAPSGFTQWKVFLAKRAKRLTVRCNDGASALELRETLIPAQSDNGKCEVVLDYEDRALGCEVSLGNKWLPGPTAFSAA